LTAPVEGSRLRGAAAPDVADKTTQRLTDEGALAAPVPIDDQPAIPNRHPASRRSA